MQIRLTIEIPGTGFIFTSAWMADAVAENTREMLDELHEVKIVRLPGENGRILSMNKHMIDRAIFLIDERDDDETA